jgi:predicted lipase
MLVYVRDHDFVTEQLKKASLGKTKFFEKSATQSFVSSNKDFAIVCFRGTETSEVQDILTDINLPLIDNGSGFKVHKGFKVALDLVWDDIESHLQSLTSDNPELKVWFTGHSLGAALATLAAVRYGSTQGLYTFGSPRVGNETLAVANDLAYRFVNNNDAVTLVPPAVGYKHIGSLQYIDEDGIISTNPSQWQLAKSRAAGHLDHLGTIFSKWGKGDLTAIVSDNLSDHAPIYYVTHTWNNYVKKQHAT